MAHDSEHPGKYGHPIPHDPDFSGPLKHRSCTDVLCLLLFFVFLGCWIGIGIYAIRNGDPSAILIPKDSNGLRCGVDSGVTDKPYLFFFDLTQCIKPSVPFLGCPTPQVCLKECPTKFYYNKGNNDDYGPKICRESVCATWYLPSTPVLKRCLYNVADRKALKQIPSVQADEVDVVKKHLNPVAMWLTLIVQNGVAFFTDKEPFHQGRCIPILNDKAISWLEKTLPIGEIVDNIKEAVDNIKIITETEQLGQNVVNDLMESWPKILVGLLVALFVTLMYIMLLRWTAGVMVWVSIIGVIVALALGTYGSWYSYRNMLNEEKGMDPDTVESFHNLKKYFWLTALIVCSVMLAIILLITIFLRNRITLAIALIEEGSKAISSVTSVFVFPIFPWVLQIIVIAFALATALLLTTTGTPLFKVKLLNTTESPSPACQPLLNQECIPSDFSKKGCVGLACKMIRMEHNKYYDYMHWFNIVGFFWGTFFVSALGQMILASVFATWYWTKPRYKLPFFAVTSSTCTVLRYHLGTLAFGSLIITICRMVRLVLEYIDRKLKKYDNEVTRAIMCLLKCFFWCLEKFLRFINTNAYIMCAIHGRNFCSSAKEAFMLLMRNIIRVFVLDKVTDFLFFISSILISVGMGVLAYFFFTAKVKFLDDGGTLNYVEVPVAVIVLCTYFISTIFFNVYSMAVDTLFLCFLEDCERNDGSPSKPYFMSKDLMKIFGKKNKVE